jgi:hypothetical protein
MDKPPTVKGELTNCLNTPEGQRFKKDVQDKSEKKYGKVVTGIVYVLATQSVPIDKLIGKNIGQNIEISVSTESGVQGTVIWKITW